MSREHTNQPSHARGQPPDSSSVALTAVALQDHWSRSLKLGTNFGPRKVGLGPAAKAKQKREIKSQIDTGRNRGPKKGVKEDNKDKEYVLDEQPPPLTLAQKFGLVHAPKPLLSEQEWSSVKAKSNQRDDSNEPCVICKEDFGLQEQVLLSCTHVFHRACLQAFERFTGKKTCPMCRHEQYQTRVIHEGARVHKHRSATMIQSWWRGYVVRCWYRQLRETVPPKDPKLRKKFYEEKLSAIVDRMIKSIDVNMAEFMREIDNSVQQSRAVFSQWDAVHNEITPEQWDAIQLKAVERGDTDCPICLTELHLTDDFNSQNNTASNTPVPHSHHKAVGQTPSKQKSNRDTNGKSNTNNNRRKNEDKKLLAKLGKHAEKLPEVSGDSDDENESTTAMNEQKNRKKCENTVAVCGTEQGVVTASTQNRRIRSTVLLSCTHVFHSTCLKTLEEIAMLDMKNSCPVCRTHYQKKIIVF